MWNLPDGLDRHRRQEGGCVRGKQCRICNVVAAAGSDEANYDHLKRRGQLVLETSDPRGEPCRERSPICEWTDDGAVRVHVWRCRHRGRLTQGQAVGSGCKGPRKNRLLLIATAERPDRRVEFAGFDINVIGETDDVLPLRRNLDQAESSQPSPLPPVTGRVCSNRPIVQETHRLSRDVGTQRITALSSRRIDPEIGVRRPAAK